MYTNDILQLRTNGGDISLNDYVENDEWILKSSKQTILNSTYTKQKGYISCLEIELEFVRRALYFSFNMVLPTLVITILSISGIVLPFESCEQIGLRKLK